MKRSRDSPEIPGHQRGRPRYKSDSPPDHSSQRSREASDSRGESRQHERLADRRYVEPGSFNPRYDRSADRRYAESESSNPRDEKASDRRRDRSKTSDRRAGQTEIFERPASPDRRRQSGRSDHSTNRRGGHQSRRDESQTSRSSSGSNDRGRDSSRSSFRGRSPRARGRGGARGSGRGRGRGGQRHQREDAFPPPDKVLLVTKPGTATKQGNHKQKVLFKTNYFRLLTALQFDFIQYRVDFNPEVESTAIKKSLMRPQKMYLGGYLFDGTSLYVTKRLEFSPLVLTSKTYNDETISINFREVAVVSKTSYIAFHIMNLIMRHAMEGLSLQLVGRNFFDADAKIPIDQFRIELWPGYTTSIRQHERDILLGVEIIHKVMRTENIYQIMTDCIKSANGRDFQEVFKKRILGTTVLTDYNNKTYRIDDVDFDTTPADVFPTKQGETSFVEYYRKKYNIIIRDHKQPLLISRAKARDIRAGMAEQIALIPELCRATGITNDMRTNFNLMKACADYTRLDPMNYQRRLHTFNKRLKDSPRSAEALNDFNLVLDQHLVEVHGAILPAQKIVFGNSREVEVENSSWDNELRDCRLYNSVLLKRWFVICPKTFETEGRNFIKDLIRVGGGMQFRMEEPTWVSLHNDQMDSYRLALDEILNQDPSMIFIVVTNNRSDRYSLIKRKTLIGRSVPSQVVLLKTIKPKQKGAGVLSVATKVAIQINCKLGGVPWMIPIPLAGLMTVGFDVYHDTNDKSRSYGALIATMDLQKAQEAQHTKFFSSVSAHRNGEELSNDISINIRKALIEFKNQHGCLPKRMLFYRDGVGDGQIEYVKMHEVAQVKTVFSEIYGQLGDELPKFTYIVVNKKINTRIFKGDKNPEPGSIIDDVVTLPERYDFYMVAQSMRQGTVAPTSYNIIEDTFGMPAERIQELTYRFCHLYFNWGGTVRTPAVCQYAHKLAYLVGEYLHQAPSNGSERSLYFL